MPSSTLFSLRSLTAPFRNHPPPTLRLVGKPALMLTAFLLSACGGTRTNPDSAAVGASESAPAPPVLTAPDLAHAASANADASPTRQTLLDSGRVYYQACAICHGGNGRGGRGPAVANSDYVQADRTRLIRTVLEGVREPIYVNGVRWKTGEMLGWGDVWDDFRIAAVLTYIRVTFNDSTVTGCTREDFEAGTWASCTLEPRAEEEIARDSVSVSEVAAVRR